MRDHPESGDIMYWVRECERARAQLAEAQAERDGMVAPEELRQWQVWGRERERERDEARAQLAEAEVETTRLQGWLDAVARHATGQELDYAAIPDAIRRLAVQLAEAQRERDRLRDELESLRAKLLEAQSRVMVCKHCGHETYYRYPPPPLSAEQELYRLRTAIQKVLENKESLGTETLATLLEVFDEPH